MLFSPSPRPFEIPLPPLPWPEPFLSPPLPTLLLLLRLDELPFPPLLPKLLPRFERLLPPLPFGINPGSALTSYSARTTPLGEKKSVTEKKEPNLLHVKTVLKLVNKLHIIQI